MELRDTLEGIRRALALTQGEFADRLGVSRNTWASTCSGRLPIRFEVIAGAVREFGGEPTLIQDVVAYLRATPRKAERN